MNMNDFKHIEAAETKNKCKKLFYGFDENP